MFTGYNPNARQPIFIDPKKPVLSTENRRAQNKNDKRLTNGSNTNMENAYAEIEALNNAYLEGKTKGQKITIRLEGDKMCSHCMTDITVAAIRSGAKEVMVINLDGQPAVIIRHEKINGNMQWTREKDGKNKIVSHYVKAKK